MPKTKQIQRRNLPLNTTYTLVSSYYSDLENGCVCENCGRLITNVAQIKANETGRAHIVGMDCAATLTGITQTLAYIYATNNFSAAKTARARILKRIKQGATVVTATSMTTDNNYHKEARAGGWETTGENDSPANIFYDWHNYPAQQWQEHVFPMIKDLIR